jgi:beta-glucosidase
VHSRVNGGAEASRRHAFARAGAVRSGVTQRFPPSFLWGASTASHQVEGGNRWNDWWPLETSGRLPHRSGDACKQYELFESDFDLAQSWNHNAHRLSIEWSRIEPREGEWDEAAVAHYSRVFGALLERGIEPVVTLHHFTNPAWFAAAGGWTDRRSVARFAKYAAFIAERFSGQVRFWVTINEPTVYTKHAYVIGDWPPCIRGAYLKSAVALVNLYRAHCAAYEALHRARSDAVVGFAHSAPYVVACNPRRALDRFAARMRDFVLNESQFVLLRVLGGARNDFIGLNYYARQVVRWQFGGRASLFGTECREDHHGEPRRFSALGWEVHAGSLRQVLMKFSGRGVPLMITENGIATGDEEERSEYLRSHLAALAEAVGAGVNVVGYFYWSLIDNFEWAEGFGPRFGLAAVDFSTQARSPRPAAALLAAFCAEVQRGGSDYDRE